MTDEVGYAAWTVAEMKAELRLRGLKVSGSRAELVERLEEHDEETEVEEKPEEETMTVEGVIDALGAILEALGQAAEGKSVTIVINPHGRLKNNGGIPEQDLHDAGDAPAKSRVNTHDARNWGSAVDLDEEAGEKVDREDVRNAARKLLTIQPDGRKKALNVLAQYGGSVSAVSEADLPRVLADLLSEL